MGQRGGHLRLGLCVAVFFGGFGEKSDLLRCKLPRRCQLVCRAALGKLLFCQEAPLEGESGRCFTFASVFQQLRPLFCERPANTAQDESFICRLRSEDVGCQRQCPLNMVAGVPGGLVPQGGQAKSGLASAGTSRGLFAEGESVSVLPSAEAWL